MYINSSNITLPDDNDTIVWKYLDLSKFFEYGRDYSVGQTSASSLPAGNASSVDYEQDYLSNNDIDINWEE